MRKAKRLDLREHALLPPLPKPMDHLPRIHQQVPHHYSEPHRTSRQPRFSPKKMKTLHMHHVNIVYKSVHTGFWRQLVVCRLSYVA